LHLTSTAPSNSVSPTFNLGANANKIAVTPATCNSTCYGSAASPALTKNAGAPWQTKLNKAIYEDNYMCKCLKNPTYPPTCAGTAACSNNVPANTYKFSTKPTILIETTNSL